LNSSRASSHAVRCFIPFAVSSLSSSFTPRTKIVTAHLTAYTHAAVPKAYIAAPLDLTNALFYLAGFAALAAFLNGLLFCRGDVCHAAQAAVAFGAFSFAAWTASAVLTCLELFKAKRGSIRSPKAAAATSSSPGMKEVA